MIFETYSSIYPERGFSPNPVFWGRPQYFPPFTAQSNSVFPITHVLLGPALKELAQL